MVTITPSWANEQSNIQWVKEKLKQCQTWIEQKIKLLVRVKVKNDRRSDFRRRWRISFQNISYYDHLEYHVNKSVNCHRAVGISTFLTYFVQEPFACEQKSGTWLQAVEIRDRESHQDKPKPNQNMKNITFSQCDNREIQLMSLMSLCKCFTLAWWASLDPKNVITGPLMRRKMQLTQSFNSC